MTDVILRILGMDCGRARAAHWPAHGGHPAGPALGGDGAARCVQPQCAHAPPLCRPAAHHWPAHGRHAARLDEKYIVKGSAVLVVTLGLSMLVKGIRLFGM